MKKKEVIDILFGLLNQVEDEESRVNKTIKKGLKLETS